MTPVGNQILVRCNEIIVAWDHRPPAPDRDFFVVATAGSVLHDLIPQAVSALRRPGQAASVLLFDTFVPTRFVGQLVEKRVDLGIAWHGGNSVKLSKSLGDVTSTLRVEPLSDPTGIAILLPPGHRLANGNESDPIPPSELTTETIIYPPLLPIRKVARRLGAAHRVRVADFPAVARQVSTGLGVGLYPNHPVHLRPAARVYGVTARRLDVKDHVQLCTYSLASVPVPREMAALSEALLAAVQDSTKPSPWNSAPMELIDAADWAGNWKLAVGSMGGRFESHDAQAETAAVVTLDVPGLSASRFVGVATPSSVALSRKSGAGPLALTLVRVARKARTGQSCYCGYAVETTPLGVVSVPVVLGREPLTASDWYWLTER
ncbi:MAG: LysR substrate-binding domain-containing protein [Fimbriiglobus sp.]